MLINEYMCVLVCLRVSWCVLGCPRVSWGLKTDRPKVVPAEVVRRYVRQFFFIFHLGWYGTCQGCEIDFSHLGKNSGNPIRHARNAFPPLS